MPDNYVPSAEMAQTLLNIQTEIRAGLILPPQTEAALGFNLACHRANRIIRDYLKGRGRAPKMTAPAQECAADAVTAKVTKRWDALRRIVLALYVAASEQNAADAERRAKKTIAQFLAFAAEKRATDGWWCSTCKAREGRPHQATCQRQGIVTEADCQKEPHA